MWLSVSGVCEVWLSVSGVCESVRSGCLLVECVRV